MPPPFLSEGGTNSLSSLGLARHLYSHTLKGEMSDSNQEPPTQPGPDPSSESAGIKQRRKASDRLKSNFRHLMDEARVLVLGPFSGDRPTRRMSLFFLASLVSVLLVLGIAWNRAREVRLERQRIAAETEARLQKEAAEKLAEENRRKDTVRSLGHFTIQLRKDPDAPRRPGVQNLAEVEVVIECDYNSTCSYVKEHGVEARNLLIELFSDVDRRELLSRDGKDRLKRAISRKLNRWLPEGKIQNVYFPRLIVS